MGTGLADRGGLPKSVLAAVFESLIGALLVDGGIEAARAFILTGMREIIERAAGSGHQYNFKSVLQQAAQEAMGQPPQYMVLDEKGPDHAKCFEVAVEIGARRFASCWGSSKKQAEQQAALEAMLELGLAERGDDGEVRLLRGGQDADAIRKSATRGGSHRPRRPPKGPQARGSRPCLAEARPEFRSARACPPPAAATRRGAPGPGRSR